MNPLVNRILLALALLLSQTAIAMHDIHCLDGEHDETCEIYFTQDQSANNTACEAQLEIIVCADQGVSTSKSFETFLDSFYYLTRAPPLGY